MEKKKESKKNIKKVNNNNTKKKSQKGFTLIELLAVIIILGVLMIIAIPSVTTYISNSRKSAYIDTAKEIISGARNVVNSGTYETYDQNTTYYLPVSCIGTEGEATSPYGSFTKAYVAVIYTGSGYKYYWISNDSAGQGIKKITSYDALDTGLIESNVTDLEIAETIDKTGIGSRESILILNDNCNAWNDALVALRKVPEESNGNGEVYNGLTYDGEPIVISYDDLKNRLEARCLGENVGEGPVYFSFEKTHENFAYVTLNNYFNNRADVGLNTSVSVETDAETGDSRVVAGMCSVDSGKLSNLNISKFLYNGEPVTREYLEEIANNQCDDIREVLESLDTECIRHLINQ